MADSYLSIHIHSCLLVRYFLLLPIHEHADDPLSALELPPQLVQVGVPGSAENV